MAAIMAMSSSPPERSPSTADVAACASTPACDTTATSRAFRRPVSAVGLQVVESFDNLEEALDRPIADGYGPMNPSNDLVLIRTSTEWQRSPTIALRQPRPLPVTVLSLIALLEVGGHG